MIKKIVELRGREATNWLASLDGNPDAVQAVHTWAEREETYRLRVEVEEPTGWQVRGTLLGGGPLLSEDRVIPLDVSRARGTQLHIRLRPPAGFWAFNSFAVAYGASQAVNITRVAAQSARTSEGKDVLPDLSASDDRYYLMPSNSDRAEINFPAPQRKAGVERTIFLHSRGWYQLHLRQSGEPDTEALTKIMLVPGGAARFAAAGSPNGEEKSDKLARTAASATPAMQHDFRRHPWRRGNADFVKPDRIRRGDPSHPDNRDGAIEERQPHQLCPASHYRQVAIAEDAVAVLVTGDIGPPFF
jgi:hypothetical protein